MIFVTEYLDFYFGNYIWKINFWRKYILDSFNSIWIIHWHPMNLQFANILPQCYNRPWITSLQTIEKAILTGIIDETHIVFLLIMTTKGPADDLINKPWHDR